MVKLYVRGLKRNVRLSNLLISCWKVIWFHAVIGVKQGGVLSPVLFCIYLDGLLRTLCSSKIGCFVGTMFTGILASADDITILAPTPQAMRCMLSICEKYAAEFGVMFNANKSKCIVCTPRFSKTVRRTLASTPSLRSAAMKLNLCKVGPILVILCPVQWMMKMI